MAAQGVRISGAVVHVAGSDSTPLAGVWVALHRLGPAGAAPADSARTDRAGRYGFTRPAADTAARYLVAVRFAGVAYVTDAVAVAAGPVQFPSVAVFDTSSAEPVELWQRHTLVQPPTPDGSLPVLELLVLRNPGGRTRTVPDDAHPAWQGRLLLGARDVEIGESDVSADAVLHRGDSIAVRAPIPPGTKQIVLTYLLPGSRRELVVPADQAVGEVDLMLADTTARRVAGPLRVLGITAFENTRYLRLEGRDVPVGAPSVLRLGPRPLAPGDLWWVVVAVAALGLVLALGIWWRRDRVVAGLTDTEILAAQIAALDAAPGGAADDARARRRAELVRRLAARLRGRAAVH